MSRARELFGRYVAQRTAFGEGRLVLPAVRLTPVQRQAGGSAARAEATPTAAPAPLAPRPPVTASTARTAPKGGGGRAATQPRWKQGAPPIPSRGIVVSPPASDLFSGDPLAAEDLDGIAALVRQCTKCPLCRSRTQAVPGEGPADAGLVVVGEGPGVREDETGRPFVGRAGELLTEILSAIELPREAVFICNVVKCRPPDNRKPAPEEIEACVPYLYRQIELIRPAVILAMGGTAAETLLGVRQSLNALRNRVHEFRGIPLVVTYHPAALLRNPQWKKPTWDDVRIARQLLDQRR